MTPINTVVFPIVRRDYILTAIKSLRKVTPDNFQVIVVDQTRPVQPEFEIKLSRWADLVIKCQWNYGFAQASNMGARLASTKYVTISNDDLIFLPGWWEGIESTFARLPEAAAVNPFSPKDPHWEGGEEMAPLASLGTKAATAKLREEKNDLIIDGIMMWCTVFNRERWDEVGYFDERFIPGAGEDYDALARIYQAGYRAVGSSLSWVWHWWSKSKDHLGGMESAQPQRRPAWNKLSTKGFGDEGLWHPDCNQWGKDCERTDPEIKRMPL